MSLTHRDLAGLVAALYDAPDSVPWLYLSNPDAVVVFGIVRIDDHLIVAYRGSYRGRDWLLDVLVPDIDPIGRPTIKRVHSGFYTGTVEAWDIVMMFRKPTDKIVIIGHSLGGARAEIEAEHALAVDVVPHLVVTWGQPAPFKPGMPAPGWPMFAYRNDVEGDEDDVTWSTDIAGYRHRIPFTDVSMAPAVRNRLDPFDLHHFVLYHAVTPETEVPT